MAQTRTTCLWPLGQAQDHCDTDKPMATSCAPPDLTPSSDARGSARHTSHMQDTHRVIDYLLRWLLPPPSETCALCTMQPSVVVVFVAVLFVDVVPDLLPISHSFALSLRLNLAFQRCRARPTTRPTCRIRTHMKPVESRARTCMCELCWFPK